MALSDWFIWWRQEMRSWLTGWQSALMAKRGPRIRIEGDKVLYCRGDRIIESISLDPANTSAGGDLVISASTRLAFDPEDGLERVIAPLRLPASKARQIAALDLTNATPVDPDDVCLLYSSCVTSASGTSYYVIKRSRLESVLQVLGKRKTRLAGIVATGKTASYRADRSLMRQFGLIPLGRRFRQRLFAASLALLTATSLATLGHLYWRDRQALTGVETQIADARSRVADIRRANLVRKERIEKIEALRRTQNEKAPVVAIWEELTRIVPDSAWVSELTVDGDTVKFSGFAKAASTLIAGLNASPLFQDPSFVGQVVRDPNSGRERFSVTMQLEAS